MSAPNTFHLVNDPAFVSRALLTSLHVRAAAIRIRAEQRHTADLHDRIAMSEVLAQVDRWIYDARAWLSALGLPSPSLFASTTTPAVEGCRGSSPAAMAHGCAALAVGAGAPLVTHPDRLHNRTDNPLFFGEAEKELPLFHSDVNNRPALAGEKLL